MQKNPLLYSTFPEKIFFEKKISKMAVQAVRRYIPCRTGPVAVPAVYHRDSSRYGLNQKTRNCIGVFRKNFFSFFCFGKKFYIGKRIKELGLDSARRTIVRLRQIA